MTVAQLTSKRMEIIGEITKIKSMRKGILNKKHQKVKHKNGDVVVKGPYFELTKKGAGGKTIAKSIPASDAEHVQAEVDNYKRFRQLSEEFIDVCENISLLQKNDNDECKKN